MSFLSYTLNAFNTCVKKIEGNDVTILELYGTLAELRAILQEQIESVFFGSNTRTLLRNFGDAETELAAKNEFLSFCKTLYLIWRSALILLTQATICTSPFQFYI